VLPTSAEQVSEVLKLANRLKIPVVPRAGGTGLAVASDSHLWKYHCNSDVCIR
jgi:FAD/FMN-containing dehydrogenase